MFHSLPTPRLIGREIEVGTLQYSHLSNESPKTITWTPVFHPIPLLEDRSKRHYPDALRALLLCGYSRLSRCSNIYRERR